MRPKLTVRAALPLVLASLVALLAASSVAAEDLVKVSIVEAKQQALTEEVPLSGSVTSPKRAMISTQVAGLIDQLQVDAGDVVAAGDLLLKLDPVLSEIDRDSAAANVQAARAALSNSQRRLEEAETLSKQNNIAASEVRTRRAQVDIDAANLQVAEAEARRRSAELERHSIVAPFAGTVSRKLAEQGEWLSPGAQVVELIATDNLRIDFQVPQRFYPRISDNTRLRLSFDAFPERAFNARVHRTVPLNSENARTFLLRTRLDEATPQSLVPGMSASAVLKLQVAEQGITVPRDAVQRYPDGRVSVWVLDKLDAQNNTAEVREQQIETGISFAEQTEVRQGLRAGQAVVTRGNEALNNGQKVQIVTDK
ncbi:MAG TPA: efflux RND transporter periplasmic adaptor subunit [Marinagarivorans sp.]